LHKNFNFFSFFCPFYLSTNENAQRWRYVDWEGKKRKKEKKKTEIKNGTASVTSL